MQENIFMYSFTILRKKLDCKTEEKNLIIHPTDSEKELMEYDKSL